MNWGDSSLWTNSDFELLSDKIFEKTVVRLSISTLKRIWGKVKYDNSPTAATLNALANFLGYASWRDFESEQSKTAPVSAEPVASAPQESIAVRRRMMIPRRIAVPVAILVIGLVVVFLLVKGRSPHRFDPAKATFEHREVTDDLPNSVVFDYDVTAYDADSAFIQQNWDPMRREKVPLGGKQHTSVYYEPGYFLAKLIVNDTIVKEDVVWIKTKGWKGILLTDKTPIYVSDTRLGDKRGFTSELLREKWESPIFTEHAATLQNVRDFNADVNSFEFETLLRNTSTAEECVCRRAIVYLLTSEMAIIVPLSTKGCISELGILTTNGWKSGKENDLSAFGCEFKDMEKLNVGIKDSVLNISLNDNIIFTEKQVNPGGKIVGVRVAFEGAGEMQYAKINGKVIE
ncbi:MAG TPA: hypothetical protein VF473_06745 [Cyclobacteriaceae bacterium]